MLNQETVAFAGALTTTTLERPDIFFKKVKIKRSSKLK